MTTSAPQEGAARRYSSAPGHRRVSWGVGLAAVLLMAWLLWFVADSMLDSDPPRPLFEEVQLEPLFEDGVLSAQLANIPPWPGSEVEPGESLGASGRREPDVRSVNDTAASGAIAGSEAIVGEAIGSDFSRLDRNRDGRISPAEFAIFEVENVRPRWQGNKADDLPPYVSTGALNRSIGGFRHLDVNGDWFLNAAEWSASLSSAPLSKQT